MTWGISTARHRPSGLPTRGAVCHVHTDRAAAERCGALLGGPPDPVKLEYSEVGVTPKGSPRLPLPQAK